MEVQESLLTKNVFVAGRPPSVTYNPRDDRHLELEVTRFLDQGPGKALSISGPTKSGKTVLVERLMPEDEAIWMHGSDLESVDQFWGKVVDWLGLYDLVEVTMQSGGTSGTNVGGTLGIRIASINYHESGQQTQMQGSRVSRKQALNTVAREGLKELTVPIVIDDFHYVADTARRPIARAIKTVIPLCSVVLIAVPHEAFNAVRNEPDMGGRVSHLGIELWSADELRYIAERGFEALNIADEHGIGQRLAENSYGAPFLMQELCFEYANSIGVLKTAAAPVATIEPRAWNAFFKRIAERNPPVIFENLLKGPKTRGQQRIDRVFKSGGKTDIYGALMDGIAKVGKASLSYQELGRMIERELMEPISGQQITLSLGHMAAIAEEHRSTGDPAVAYKDDMLHVLDPFLLFYLRYGTWDVTK